MTTVLNLVTPNYIIPLIGVVGAFAVAFFAHRLTIERDRLNARRNAATAFRTAFLAPLTGLYPLPLRWPNDIDQFLRNAAPTLQNAVTQFRPFLPWWKRWAFDRAWFKFRCGTGRDIDLQNYHRYIAFGSNPDAKGIFRRNVDKVLSFAK